MLRAPKRLKKKKVARRNLDPYPTKRSWKKNLAMKYNTVTEWLHRKQL